MASASSSGSAATTSAISVPAGVRRLCSRAEELGRDPCEHAARGPGEVGEPLLDEAPGQEVPPGALGGREESRAAWICRKGDEHLAAGVGHGIDQGIQDLLLDGGEVVEAVHDEHPGHAGGSVAFQGFAQPPQRVLVVLEIGLGEQGLVGHEHLEERLEAGATVDGEGGRSRGQARACLVRAETRLFHLLHQPEQAGPEAGAVSHAREERHVRASDGLLHERVPLDAGRQRAHAEGRQEALARRGEGREGIVEDRTGVPTRERHALDVHGLGVGRDDEQDIAGARGSPAPAARGGGGLAHAIERSVRLPAPGRAGDEAERGGRGARGQGSSPLLFISLEAESVPWPYLRQSARPTTVPGPAWVTGQGRSPGARPSQTHARLARAPPQGYPAAFASEVDLRATLNPHVRITGTGAALPERIVDNDELESLVTGYDQTHSGPFGQWVDQVTHIHERRYCTPGQRTSDYALVAARQALDAAGIEPTDLDLIIYASFTPSQTLPGDHCRFAQALGATRTATFNLMAACAGSVYAMGLAYGMIASGVHRHVLVIGAETISRVLNFHDPLTSILFGDGAGAVVLSRNDATTGKGMLPPDMSFQWSPRNIHQANSNVPVDVGLFPDRLQQPGVPLVEQAMVEMEGGPNVLRKAVIEMAGCTARCLGYEPKALRSMPPDLRETLDRAWVVPHQANGRILDGLADRLKIGKNRLIRTIYRYGNMSAASNLVALDHAIRYGNTERELDADGHVVRIVDVPDARIQDDDLVLMPSIGGGYLMGCVGFIY